MLLSPRVLKSLNSIEKMQPIIMGVTLNSSPSWTIISCHSPTNARDETDLITFNNEPSSLVRSISKHNVLIIGWDMNARIGKNENNKFSLHNSSNKNGEHLTDFSLENGLTYLNIKFQKKKRKLCAYTYTNNDKAQIDYIFMNKKWINSALNCEEYSSFKGAFSDHNTQEYDVNN